MHSDFHKNDITDLEVEGRIFKFKIPTGEESNSWVDDYLVPDPISGNFKVSISEKNWCYMKNIVGVPYTSEDYEGLGVPKKEWQELDWKHRRIVLSHIDSLIFEKLKDAIANVISNSAEKKNLKSESKTSTETKD